MSLLQSGGVIDTITSHSNNFTHTDENFDKFTLVSGFYTTEYFTLVSAKHIFLFSGSQGLKLSTCEASGLQVLAC